MRIAAPIPLARYLCAVDWRGGWWPSLRVNKWMDDLPEAPPLAQAAGALSRTSATLWSAIHGEDRLLKVDEVAQLLRTDPATVRRKIREGCLDATKPCGH